MIDLPDAPWIRDAELNGIPGDDKPCCPTCGSDLSDYFYRFQFNNEIIGCDVCLKKIEVWDWLDEQEGQT